jgi:ribosome maturation factor RimP
VEQKLLLNEKIRAVLEEPIRSRGYELVLLKLSFGPVVSLDINIDRLDGNHVSVDDCVVVSQVASVILDVENLIDGRYKLNVSSPGEYRPLESIESFQRFCGREIRLELYSKINEKRKISGKLLRIEQNANDTIVYLKEECDTSAGEIAVFYTNVKKAAVRRFF